MSLDLRPAGSEPDPTLLDTEPADSKSAEDQAAVMAGAVEPDVSAVEKPRALPVAAAERYFAVDALRGFALLGILAMNIVLFSWPQVAYGKPIRGGGFEGTDRVVWFVNHLVFEAKMMTIFSMLFGAGLVLMDGRAAKRGVSIRGVYYRRILWLLLLGMIHAYLIWSGDILVMYAETGLFLYFFRNLRPRTLIVTGVVSLVLFVPLMMGFSVWVNGVKLAFERLEAQQQAAQAAAIPDRAKAAEDPKPATGPVADTKKADTKPRSPDQWKHDLWKEHLQEFLEPTPEQRRNRWDKEMTAHRGSYIEVVKHRAPAMLVGQILMLIFAVPFFTGGRMLIGMGLMKLGVFSASRSRPFYLAMMLAGYGIGIPLMVYDARRLIAHEFSSRYKFFEGGMFYNDFGSIIVALGHVGAMMLIVQSGALGWLVRRLAAVGRMALTNYLTHSIFFTTLFYGHGFGLYGTINRTGLAAMVLAMWAFQLVVSPIWLRHFRFGPAEWLWRSLTYWQPQPMRIEPPQAPALSAA